MKNENFNCWSNHLETFNCSNHSDDSDKCNTFKTSEKSSLICGLSSEHMQLIHPCNITPTIGNSVPMHSYCHNNDDNNDDSDNIRQSEEQLVNIETFTCGECYECFVKLKDLKLHIQQIHSNNATLTYGNSNSNGEYRGWYEDRYNFNQEYHGKLTNSDNYIGKHSSTRCSNNVTNFTFSHATCERSFQYEKQTIVHKPKYNTIKPYCSVCGNTCRCDSPLKLHLNQTNANSTKIHNELNDSFVSYSSCGKSFTKKDHLEDHILANSPSPSVVRNSLMECESCSEKFKKKSHLEEHVLIHLAESVFPRVIITPLVRCASCDTCFENKSDLEQHLSIHIENSTPPNVLNHRLTECASCGKKFKKKDNLRKHVLTHFAVSVFPNVVTNPLVQSAFYGKKFKKKLSFEKDDEQHIDKKFHRCRICKKRFVTMIELRNHLAYHNDKKPYHCTVCGKSFVMHRNFQIHTSLHSKSKKFFCSTCGKMFEIEEDLLNHEAIHVRLRSNKTRVYCNETLKNQRNLRKHVLLNHYSSLQSVATVICSQTETTENAKICKPSSLQNKAIIDNDSQNLNLKDLYVVVPRLMFLLSR